MADTRFDWDPDKDAENQRKHGVSFSRAQHAFADSQRVIAKDVTHSQVEERFYCFGKVDGGVLTVRFTYRASIIRIRRVAPAPDTRPPSDRPSAT